MSRTNIVVRTESDVKVKTMGGIFSRVKNNIFGLCFFLAEGTSSGETDGRINVTHWDMALGERDRTSCHVTSRNSHVPLNVFSLYTTKFKILETHGSCRETKAGRNLLLKVQVMEITSAQVSRRIYIYMKNISTSL